MIFGIKRALAVATTIGLAMLISSCQGLQLGPGAPPVPLDPGVSNINHVIVMVQENRSFDHYFGQLPAY